MAVFTGTQTKHVCVMSGKCAKKKKKERGFSNVLAELADRFPSVRHIQPCDCWPKLSCGDQAAACLLPMYTCLRSEWKVTSRGGHNALSVGGHLATVRGGRNPRRPSRRACEVCAENLVALSVPRNLLPTSCNIGARGACTRKLLVRMTNQQKATARHYAKTA